MRMTTMCSTLSFLFALLCLNAAVSGDHISDAGRSVMVREFSDPPCTKLYSCLDCHTSRICRPNGPNSWAEVSRVKCPATAPYCNKYTGSCSNAPVADCGQEDTFICPAQKGHYPDSKNCSLYHACEEYQAKLFQCADGLYYNPISEDCEPNQDFCAGDLKCGDDGTKVPFPNQPNFFAYCYGGNPTIIDRCIGNYELNVTSQECEAVCKGDGILRDYIDCTKFYLCSTLYFSESLKVPLKNSMSCPTSQAFNPDIYMCGPINDVKGCVAPTPTPEPTYPPSSVTSTTTNSPSSTTTNSPSSITTNSPMTTISTTRRTTRRIRSTTTKRK